MKLINKKKILGFVLLLALVFTFNIGINSKNIEAKVVKKLSKSQILEQKRNNIVKEALKQKGKRYRYGGANQKGFDCSGLTSYVYKKAINKNIGRSSYAQVKKGSKPFKPTIKNLKKGDILFWGSKARPYHVGIYIGGGKYIHASTPRTGVKVEKLNGYFKPSYAKHMI